MFFYKRFDSRIMLLVPMVHLMYVIVIDGIPNDFCRAAVMLGVEMLVASALTS